MLGLLKHLRVEDRNLKQLEDRREYFYCLRVRKSFLSMNPEQLLTTSEKMILLTTSEYNAQSPHRHIEITKGCLREICNT